MKTKQAFLNGTYIGLISAAGELIALNWGVQFPTGIKPEVTREFTACERNVGGTVRKPAVEIKGTRHFKLGKDNQSLVVTVIGDQALVETNSKNPRIVSVQSAREIWSVE
jgi:hypothetical protein